MVDTKKVAEISANIESIKKILPDFKERCLAYQKNSNSSNGCMVIVPGISEESYSKILECVENYLNVELQNLEVKLKDCFK